MSTDTTAVAARRVPKQKRSRERYDRILAAARELIAARGNDAVSMREIAEHSGVPIGSMYQYFPDKNALLWTLISGHFDQLEATWQPRVQAATTYAELHAASVWLFDAFVALCRSDSSFAQLWASAQANKVLMALDQALNARIAQTIAEKMADLPAGDVPVDTARVQRASFLMASLSSTALQVAFSDAEQCDDILDEFRALMAYQFTRM